MYRDAPSGAVQVSLTALGDVAVAATAVGGCGPSFSLP
jgi:hypothetical protein